MTDPNSEYLDLLAEGYSPEVAAAHAFRGIPLPPLEEEEDQDDQFIAVQEEDL